MIRSAISPKWSVATTMVTMSLLCIAYLHLSTAQHAVNAKDTTIPSAAQLLEGLKLIVAANPLTGERWLLVDTMATMGRLFAGLAGGVAGALALGVLMGCFAPVESAFRLILSCFARIPPTAMMAVFFVLVNDQSNMYPAMIGFGILPTLALATYLEVKDVPDELVYKAYTLGASPTEVIWDVICKTTLPKMIDFVRLQIGPAMVYLIAAEMVIGDVGFGYRIRLQSRLLHMNVVYPYLLILMCFGIVMDVGLRYLQRKACPWYASAEDAK